MRFCWSNPLIGPLFEEPLTFHPRIKFARSEQFQQWFIAAAPGEVAPMLREWISDIIDIKIHEARLPVSQFLFAKLPQNVVCVILCTRFRQSFLISSW